MTSVLASWEGTGRAQCHGLMRIDGGRTRSPGAATFVPVAGGLRRQAHLARFAPQARPRTTCARQPKGRRCRSRLTMELEVESLSARTPDDEPLFGPISFKVRRGDTQVIAGPSGSGKSTMLKAIAQMLPDPRLDAREGESDDDQPPPLKLDGQPAGTFNPTRWRAMVMHIPQTTKTTLPGTPQDLLNKVAEFRSHRHTSMRKEELRNYMQKFGLTQSFADKPWGDMSGGEAQRAILAVALSVNPLYLLLDEPTNALDKENSRLAEEVLLQSDCGLVWVSHDEEQQKRLGGDVIRIKSGSGDNEGNASASGSQAVGSDNTEGHTHGAEPERRSGGMMGRSKYQLIPFAGALGASTLLPGASAKPDAPIVVAQSSGGMQGGTMNITPIGLALTFACILTATTASNYLGYGISSNMLVASVRCILQLFALGYILYPIFNMNNPAVVTAYLCFMLSVAAQEALQRLRFHYKGIILRTYISVGLAVATSGFISLFIILRVGLNAWYAIPLVGMLLGNSMTSVSVALSDFVNELKSNPGTIELYLSMGANRVEATRPMLQKAMRQGLTSIINQMSVAGLVAIPGMMTGQILGGQPPINAARYQIMVLMLNCTTAFGSIVLITRQTLVRMFDRKHRLRNDRLYEAQRSTLSISNLVESLFAWIGDRSKEVWRTVS